MGINNNYNNHLKITGRYYAVGTGTFIVRCKKNAIRDPGVKNL